MTSYRAPARSVGQLKRPFGNLYYEVSGSGPALLFAHGLGGNHLSWWQQVAHFAPHYSCVAFAHRGFAPSDAIDGGPDPADYAGDLEALVDHLKFPDVRLVGQSMGGWTVLEYAIAQPAKVKALVLSSTSGTLDRRGCDPSGGGTYDAWLADAETKIAAGLAHGVHPAVGMGAAARSPALHLLYASIDTMAGALDKEKVRSGLRRTAKRTLAELKGFRVPTLLIAGGEDVVFPPFLASAIAAGLPCGQAHLIPHSGHSPYFEEAATFNGLVEAFLARQR
jgi:3-oxoadipate enol-lactonase